MTAPLTPTDLRTEYASFPLGLDSIPPRFSWTLEGRGEQRAYRIVAAGSERLLKQAAPDLWDSGKVESATHTFIPYAGTALRSGQRVYWKVQIWNEKGGPVESGTAWFETGLLKDEDWKGVFVSAPFCGAGGRGYHSAVLKSGQQGEFWVQVDLGRVRSFDRVAVHPAYYREWGQEKGAGFGFPVRFKIEAAADGGFHARELLFETPADVPPPGVNPVEIRLPAKARTRFVRLTATKPWTTATGETLLALDELQVFNGDENVALGRAASCSNFLQANVRAGGVDWHVDCLTDGVIHVDVPRHDQGRGNLLRRRFRLAKPVSRARAYIASRGWYELSINGRKAGDAVLDSAWTVFDRRVLYSTWDVTRLLRKGDNVVTVMLGLGWTLDPAFILQLNIDHGDGTRTCVASDGQWRLMKGPVVENHVYHGETHDARLENPAVHRAAFDDRAFPPAPTLPDYRPALSAQMNPPIRVTDTIKPVGLAQPKPGVWVFDLGRNIAGWARLRVKGRKGQTITLRFAECVFDDGSVWTDAAQSQARREGRLCVEDGMINNATYRTARATDRYICKGSRKEEVWEPRFTYHGFRFVEVTGLAGRPALRTIVGRAVHTDVPSIGSFECADPVLNWAQEATRRTLLNNLHSVPTDCPQRDERQGWMGDAQIVSESMLCNFDAASTYAKWLRDMRDDQRADGAIGDTTPYTLARMGGDVPWGCAIVVIPWNVYVYTGDRRVLETHFESMLRYVDFVARTYPGRIADNAIFGGDWLCTEETPPAVSNTGFFLLSARIAARCAEVLGRRGERDRMEALAGEIGAAFHQRLFDAGKGEYGNGSQFSNLWPLYLGVVPEALRLPVFEKLVASIEGRNRHLSTGFLGTKYIMELLCDSGRADLAYAIARTREFPGWGYMQAHEATTLWEHWALKTGDGMNSHDHPCFGSIAAWFMKYVAGIRPDPERPGFERVVFAPVLPDGLKRAAGEMRTVRGLVRSSWRRAGNVVHLELRVPAGSSGALTVRNALQVRRGSDVLWRGDAAGSPADAAGLPVPAGTSKLRIVLG